MYSKLKREPDAILVPRMTRFLVIKIICFSRKIKRVFYKFEFFSIIPGTCFQYRTAEKSAFFVAIR